LISFSPFAIIRFYLFEKIIDISCYRQDSLISLRIMAPQKVKRKLDGSDFRIWWNDKSVQKLDKLRRGPNIAWKRLNRRKRDKKLSRTLSPQSGRSDLACPLILDDCNLLPELWASGILR
jgi:hypothetical protein